MTVACPACRAENSERTCRRCRADLGLLWDLETQRERLFADAAEAIQRGNFDRALEFAHSVRAMRDGADAARIIACIFFLRGEFAHALAWHRRATTLA